MSAKTLVVLAAGLGTRYGGLKQMDGLGPGGETILEYSVFDAIRAGFDKAAFVIRREFEPEFSRLAERSFGRRIAVEIVFQDDADLRGAAALSAARPGPRRRPWGTTHALLAAEPAVSAPFAVVNADDFYGDQSYRALAAHLDAGTGDQALVGFKLRETLSDAGPVARAVCGVDREGLLESIAELTHIEPCGRGARSIDRTGDAAMLSGDETVSMNMWGFTPVAFRQLRFEFRRFLERLDENEEAECFLPESVHAMIGGAAKRERETTATGDELSGGDESRPPANLARVRVLEAGAQWFGVTYREDRERAAARIRRLVRSGAYPARLWA